MMELTAYTEQLAARLLAELVERGQTVTFAESCTGGGLAAAFTANAGASAALKRAYVTYCDEAKAEVLGVPREVLRRYTAVSAPVARDMALGAARAAAADVAISVTGLAGPGGDGVRPAGLVFIAVACCGRVRVVRCNFPGDRRAVRNQAAIVGYRVALKMLVEA